MQYVVRVTENAEDDIEGIGEYIAEADSPSRAAYVVAGIREVVEGLADLPRRGSHVRELEQAGRPGFREVLFKPYRIIYRVTDDAVQVLLVADGRRDMRRLLLRRLLRA